SSDKYFESYEDLNIHHQMLNDTSRTVAYKNAIFNMKSSFVDKIVMDVGAGTGILSIFSAQAGAKKIYAIEASNLANLISQVAEENNVKDKIEIIKKPVEDINSNDIQKVDIIVSEWMGFYLVHEGMLNSVIIARDKFLKPNGLMFPSIAKIYAAPCQLPSYNDFWDDICGVSMKCIAQNYRQTKSLKPEILYVPKKDILVEDKLLIWLDLNNTTLEELNSLGGEQTVLVCSKNGKYQGFCIWFDVEFPDGSLLSTSSKVEPTHWKQTVIVLPHSIHLNKKDPVAFTLNINKSSSNPRWYNIIFTMLDATEVPHDIPCDCYMSRCIITKTYMENQGKEI
ncbi:PREDICTED: protein arginine N-methyltransferase 6, partial [Ceratosolen solmsi marchali]|uniref:type I protein arginine methyltransferase n=1 Tax=Ceratosolen solmsi marchali TaxID=326594 RepID=A0AAJ6YR35_9HYME